MILTKSNPFCYSKIASNSYVEVKPNVVIRILRSHCINGYTLQYLPDIHGVAGQLSPLTEPAQLKHIFSQLHDFLVYSEAQHKDVETLNQWLNHGTEKQYITGLGIISRLMLAKYVNDPLYHDLVAEAAPIFAVQQPWRAGHRLHIDPSLENLHLEVQKRLDEMLSL